MRRRLLGLGVVLLVSAACSPKPVDECDAGACGGGAGGGAEDAGGGTGGGGGGEDAGGGAGGGGGDADAGTDAGTGDAGCGGPSRLAIVSAPQALETQACSGPVRVQLQDGCGLPVVAASAVPLGITSSAASTQLFQEGACLTSPAQWAISAGSSERSVHVMDSAPGTPTLTVTSTGLATATQVLTFTCPATQKACADRCVDPSGCCGDGDCVGAGLPWVCNASSVCEPPPCTGFPANCTTWDDRTAPGASRTVTFNSSGYTPKCMRVTTTQDVTFSGSFSLHPLQQTCGPSDRNMGTTFGTTKTVRFPNFGTYGYRCANHPAFEQGAVRVP